MKIDDIPLPPIILEENSKIELNENLNIKRVQNGAKINFPMKRIVNHKLPLGLLLKDSFRKNNDIVPKKDLYLPTSSDKIQLSLSTLKPLEKESNSRFDRSYREYKDPKRTVDNYKSNKRKSDKEEKVKLIKRCRIDRRSRERKLDYSTSRVRSQFVIRDREDFHRNNVSRITDKRTHYRDSSRDRRNRSHERRYSKRRVHHSSRHGSRCRRSPSRRRDRYESRRYNRSTDKNGNYREKNIIVSSRENRKNSRRRDVSKRRKRTLSKKSSFASSTSNLSSSSSSDSSNVELPIISPKSPDESHKSFKKSIKSIKVSPRCSPVQRAIVVPSAANEYLKQLKDTLDRINIAYKTVVSQIPDQKNCPDLELSSIPLPTLISQDYIHKTSLKSPEAMPLVSRDHQVTNGHKHSIREAYPAERMAHSSSINIDKLSCISYSSAGSKIYRSPLHSFNVSSYSKESENSDSKSKPVIPKINSYHIDYSDINAEYLAHCSPHFFVDKIHCHCSMPNPDQHNDDGIRACGRGQNCILRRLRIECNITRCPTEALCTNCNFQLMDSSTNKRGKTEIFCDSSQEVCWKLRTRSHIQKSQLLFEVGGKAAMIDSDSDAGQSPSDMLITRNIKVSLRSDPHTLIYYLTHGSPEEANVHIEKWLVNGHIRLGVFALVDIAPKTELVMFYSNDCLGVLREPVPLESEEGPLWTMHSLVHSSSMGGEDVMSVMDQVLSPICAPTTRDLCLGLGAMPLLYTSSLPHMTQDNTRILTKLVEILSLVETHTVTLGLDLRVMLDHLCEVSHTQDMLPCTLTSLDTLRTRLTTTPNPERHPKNDQKSLTNNLYSLNCRLPTYWCSRECVSADEARVFFYHKVTKSVQWDMPVYPWETNEDDNANIYDYNDASSLQVSHDEVAQMYLNLNRMYEIKQKRILCKENQPKPTKELTDAYKKESFRKKMMDFIVRLLKPYRDPGCQEGRITSDDDLRYLANKLAQTILFKELKILNNVAEYLEVTTMVETKTRTYVKTYLESRGSTYTRPSKTTPVVGTRPAHQAQSVVKNVP